jgi:2-isopropylmalate synthase
VGAHDSSSIVLGKHPGRQALRSALQELGFTVDGHALNTAFKRFKELADQKTQVTVMDLEALLSDELSEQLASYALEWFHVEASLRRPPHAAVALRAPDGDVVEGNLTGDGPWTRSSARSTPPPAARRACASAGSTR